MREFSPMNAAELMDKAVEIYKKSFWQQIAFAALVYAAGTAAVFFLSGIAVRLFFGGVLGMVFGLGFVLVPGLLFLQAFSSAGHILLSRLAFYGYPVTLGGAGILQVVGRVFSALAAQTILMIPLVALAYGAVYFVSDLSVAFTLILFFVFLAGILIFWNGISLSVAVAVYERRYFFGAINRSRELVRPQFWQIFGVRMLWFFCVIAVSFAANGILGLLGEVFFFAGIIFGFVWSVVVALASAPLSGILHAMIYFNRRMKSEGFDIEMRLGRLAGR